MSWHRLTFPESKLPISAGGTAFVDWHCSARCCTGTPGADSDVDVLVEFEPGVRVGLRFFDIQEELSDLFGRKVDLNTPNFLSRYFRDQVLKEAEDLYAHA